MRILIVSNYVPYPATSGAEVRILNLLLHITRQHEVWLACLFTPTTGEESGATYLKSICHRVELVARERRRGEFRLAQLWGLVLAEPRPSVSEHFTGMANKVRALTESERFDIIDIQHLRMAPYFKAISPANPGHKVLTLHNVNHVHNRRMISFTQDWRVKRKLLKDQLFLRQATLRYARRADRCVVVSELDRDLLKREVPDANIAVVPNGVDTQQHSFLTDEPAAPSLLFVGTMNYPPNVDGVTFFCQDILPQIRLSAPETKFIIVGRAPTSAVQALASDAVNVTGAVHSILPYYQQSLVSVVPLRAGSGTRLKILESMALGRPVVSTTLGCEGLAVTHGENILIADTPADFAAHTLRLLNDASLRRRLAANGRRLVESQYDWQVIAQRLLQVYGETLDSG